MCSRLCSRSACTGLSIWECFHIHNFLGTQVRHGNVLLFLSDWFLSGFTLNHDICHIVIRDGDEKFVETAKLQFAKRISRRFFRLPCTVLIVAIVNSARFCSVASSMPALKFILAKFSTFFPSFCLSLPLSLSPFSRFLSLSISLSSTFSLKVSVT